MIYLCILVHACSVWCCLVYLLFPVYPVCESCLVLLCPALMSLLNINLSLYPRLRVPVPPSCVHRDRRPDQNRKRRPFTPFCFPFWKVFILVPVVVYVCPAAWKSPLVIPAIAHCKSAWEFGGIAASAASSLAASPHARRSREISVASGGSPKPAGSLPSSRVAAPPGAPFAGDHATRSPLTQCPPARLWINAHRPAAVLKPAGLPLTQARRIAADSSPLDRRWFIPAGRRYP